MWSNRVHMTGDSLQTGSGNDGAAGEMHRQSDAVDRGTLLVDRPFTEIRDALLYTMGKRSAVIGGTPVRGRIFAMYGWLFCG
jgi:hypothetical protein